MSADRRTIVARYDRGDPLDQFTAEERAELRQALLASPDYFDAKATHHAMLVRDAAKLYAMDTPAATEAEE